MVTIVEVGLRDGLQNESVILSLADRAELAKKLIAAGLRRIELGSLVRADRVPQMAGTTELVRRVSSRHHKKDLRFSLLVPNETGMKEALPLPIQEVAVFTAASQTFCKKNINCSIEESLARFEKVMALQKKQRPDLYVRGYVSTCFGCPYEGWISPKQVLPVATALLKMGCDEISIGDTLGVAEPAQVHELFRLLKKKIPVKKLAGHFHNTRGLALVNIMAAFAEGVRVFDSSIGGLGGCPFAPGAAGNVATEDVVYMLQGSKIATAVDLPQLIATNHWLKKKMGKPLRSQVAAVGLKFA